MYASQHKLDTLTRGGNVNQRGKTFTVHERATNRRRREEEHIAPEQETVNGQIYRGEKWLGEKGDCQMHHRGTCKRGKGCKFNHHAVQLGVRNHRPSGSADANCNGHSNDVHLADATPDHVFMVHHGAPDPASNPRPGGDSTAREQAFASEHSNFSRRNAYELVGEREQLMIKTSANQRAWTGRTTDVSSEKRENSDHKQGGATTATYCCSVILGMLYCLLFVLPSLVMYKVCAATDKAATSITKSYKPLVFLLLLLACTVQILASGCAWTNVNTPPAHNAIKSTLYFNRDIGRSANNRTSDYEWCADSGTNRFVTNDMLDFVPGSVMHTSTTVAVGSGSVTSPLSGTVLVKSLDHGCLVECRDVLYLPSCGKKLMPVSTFVSKGSSLVIDNYDKINLTSKSGSSIFSGREFDGLYYYRCKTVQQLQGVAATSAPGTNHTADQPAHAKADLHFGLAVGTNIKATGNDFGKRLLEAHWAYGHLHFDKLRKLLGLKKGDDPDCPACTIATSRQQTLSKVKHDRAERPNYRKHLDIGYTKNYDYCFQLAVDDCTRESWLDVLDSKGDAFKSFQDLQLQHDNEYAPYKLAVLRTDSEPLYDNATWDTFCEQHGIRREFSSRHRHDQHGVAERAMQSIGVPFRCMMIQGNAPASDIPDGLRHANVIRNQSPTKANNGWTPREKAAGKRLPVNKRLMRGPLFCLVFAHVYEQERPKHAPRGIACVYLGYDDANNAYKVKEWESGKRYYTADVTFYPHRFPYRANPQRMGDFLHQFDDIAPHVVAPMPRAIEGNMNAQAPPMPRPPSARQRSYQYSAGQALVDIPDADVAPDGAASNIVVQEASSGPAADPTTWEQAFASEHADKWIAAKLAEQNSFAHHNVYELVPRSAARGKRIFKPRPVLKIKRKPPSAEHPHGEIDKFKYRLTIAAFTRMLIQGVDYEEKYASTVRWNSIKILIAIAVNMDYDIVLFDISTFFLYGKLHNEVYMEQAPGWEVEGMPKEDFVCKLNRSMYGLPEAPYCAQLELKETCTADDAFKPTTADDCIYVSGQDNTKSYAAFGAHVDDLLGIGDDEGLAKIETTLTAKFKITKEVNPAVVTGVQIERDRERKWLKLHQGAYIADLLVRHDMADCRTVDTPMDPGTARALMLLPTPSTEAPPDPTVVKKYQSLVGAFIWLLKTRPDMMFTINLASRFMKNPTQKHLDLVSGRPLRYLKSIVHYGLVFQAGDEDWVLSGASDSDLAGCLNSSKSTSGCFSKLGKSGAVMCSSSLEKKISTSTGQAETYAMQSLVKEVVWERHLLRELRFPQSNPTSLATDNAGVLKQSTKAVNHSTAKHYRIAQAYIRSMVNNKTIEVERVSTEDNAADLFTKALHAPTFLRHRATIMGPQTPVV